MFGDPECVRYTVETPLTRWQNGRLDATEWALEKRDVIGHEKLGAGPRRVVVLNDWMCDTSTWDGLTGLARAGDEVRLDAWRTRYGSRLSEGWARFKAERWSATSEPEAVARYATMFARRGLPGPEVKVRARCSPSPASKTSRSCGRPR